MAEALDNDTIMKAACIQAAAAVLAGSSRFDQVAIVGVAEKILEEMEKRGYFPGQSEMGAVTSIEHKIVDPA